MLSSSEGNHRERGIYEGLVYASSQRRLQKHDLNDVSNHLPDTEVHLVKYIRKNLPKTVAADLTKKLMEAYVKSGVCLQRKMPINNELLKSISSIDPRCRGHTATLQFLSKLPELVTNVVKGEGDKAKYDMEVTPVSAE